MKKNDIVARKSYNKDIIFRVHSINNDIAILKGIYIRLLADAPISDLVLVSDEELEFRNNADHSSYSTFLTNTKNELRHITGKILHLDSDLQYLEKCLKVYNDLGLYANGVNLPVEEFQKYVVNLIQTTNPDIVVLTGHDSYNNKGLDNLKNYATSIYFVNAVKEIRKYYSKNDLFVFAGACQSNFEALIAAGADFASSVDRTNIDAYDPAIVAVKAAITHFTNTVDIKEMFDYTKTSKASITGIETYGKMRTLLWLLKKKLMLKLIYH